MHYLARQREAEDAIAVLRWRQEHEGRAQQRAGMFPASLASHLMDGWRARWEAQDAGAFPKPAPVNAWLADQIHGLKAARYRAAYDEQLIRDHAENYAMICAALASLDGCRVFAAGMGIAPPKVRGMDEAGERARFMCPQWWRRALRRAWTRESEESMRSLGVIRKGRQPYASDEAVQHRIARAQRTREWLKSHVMANGAGEQLELLELHDKSLANPALRRGEFMCRMRGFEELAADLGHVAQFWTLTTPSRFHAQLSTGGINPAWETDRARVRDAQQWLRTMWARARAKLARLSIMFYGFRVAEPHHDGTPHWHMVLFMPQSAADVLRAVLRGVWLSDAGDEAGAAEHRAKSVAIDPSRGSATGYVAKYVSKNIDGAGAIGAEESDETGAPVSEGVARVAAWAAAHGIRQFQQIGGPPVGLWRELRRQREAVAPALIESVRQQADKGRWRDFIGALGGIERARRRVSSTRGTYRRELRRPNVRYRGGPRGGWRLRPAEDNEMPAVWMDRAEARATDTAGRDVLAATRYGETPAPRAAGVCSLGLLGRYVAIDTRHHRWRIERKCEQSGSVACSPSSQAGNSRGSVAALKVSDRSGSGLGLSSRSCGGSGSGFDSAPQALFSDLGPVAITVRGTEADQRREVERARRALVDECQKGAVSVVKQKGAVSVVKPQGTEETGTDRPAAPVLRPPAHIQREARAILERERDSRGRLQ